MKKIFSLFAAALIGLSVSAQDCPTESMMSLLNGDDAANVEIELGDFTLTGENISVFEFINKFPGIDTRIEISANTLYNKAKITKYGSPSLYFLRQDGVEVTASHNTTRIFDADNDFQNRKIIFFWNNYLENKLTIINNNLDGIYMFGSLSSPDPASSTNPRALSGNILVKGNIIKGDPRIYCNNLGQLDAVFDGNTILTSSYLFGFQNYGTSGKVIFINNHIKTIESNYHPVFYESWGSSAEQALYKIDTLCFANNVLEGTSSTPLQYLQQHMTSCTVTNVNNIYL